MDPIFIAINVILQKANLYLPGVSSSVLAVQLAILFAITLIFISITIGILAFVKSQMSIHYNRHDLFKLTTHAIAIVIGSSLSLLGLSIPLVLMAAGISWLIIDFTYAIFLEGMVNDNYINKLTADEHILTPDEIIAFEAGVQSGDSCEGFFTSWAVKESYTNYSAYTAGKILREAHTDKCEAIIDKVHKKANPN